MREQANTLEIVKEGVKTISDRLGVISKTLREIYRSFFEEEHRQGSDEDTESPAGV